MSVGRRIFFNTLVQSVGKVGATGVGLVTVALLTRYLQERGFGQYSTVLAYLGFFAVLADFGLYLYTVREISKPETNHPQIISNALGLRLALALGALIVGAGLAIFFPYPAIVKQTMFIGIAAVLLTSLNQVLVGIFQKHLVQYLVVVAETANRLMFLGLVYWLILNRLTLPYFFVALAISNAVYFILTLTFARRYEKFSVAFDLTVWRDILAVSWPLAFAVILNLLYFKTDTIILSWFRPQEAVGDYSLPYKILEGLLAFPAMFVGLVMPLLSKSAFGAWEEFKRVLQNSFDVLLLLAIPTVVTALFFAEPVINLFKGSLPYLDSPNLLRLLILAVGTIFLGTLFGYAVVAVNAQKPMIKGYLLGAVVGLILYFALIPTIGYWGAAIGTVITEITVATYAYYLIKKTSGQRLSLRVLLPALPAIVVLVSFFFLVHWEWIAEIAMGLILYLLALVVFRAIPRSLVKELLFRNQVYK